MTTPEVGTALAPLPQPATAVDYQRELDGAKMLMKSGLLPKGIASAEAAMFIVLTGRDLGLSPVQSLRSIHVIQGKIEVAADMQLGLFHRAGGKSQWVELTNEKAVLRLAAPWLIEPHTETFAMTDAKLAGLGGDNWRKYPKAMLRSRAITAGLKSIGFDATAGAYAPGEIGGEAVVVDGVVEPAPADPQAAAIAYAQATIASLGVGPVDDGNTDSAVDAVERQYEAAVSELAEVIPTLAPKQAQWARTQLDEGADPVELLDFLKGKVMPESARIA